MGYEWQWQALLVRQLLTVPRIRLFSHIVPLLGKTEVLKLTTPGPHPLEGVVAPPPLT